MNDWARQVVETIVAEFSDLHDVREITRVTLRLIVASLLGAVLGYERERSGKSAGIRTYMLVATGSAVFVMIPQLAGISDSDVTRVMQGVITGVGFLGAGAIIKREDEQAISGLTTAAGIWMASAIGMAAGLGREATAILSTALALGTFTVVPLIAQWLGSRKGRGDPDR